MISLNDLSAEDKEALLQQARQIIEEENIQKDAKTMYALKKKDLMAQTLNEMATVLNLKYSTEKQNLKDHVVSMTHYLYKRIANDKNKNQISITTKAQWQIYTTILENVKTMIIACHNCKDMKEGE